MSTGGGSNSGASSTKVVLLTGASLSWNPRALKEASALVRAGIDVIVYGSNSDQARLEADKALARRHGFRFEAAMVVSRFRFVSRLQDFLARLSSWLGRKIFSLSGIENRWQLGSLSSALLRRAHAENAHYYIVHLEQAAWVGVRLLREGKRVGIDMEDWYSEDLPAEARKGRPIVLLHSLERKLLQEGGHATCPSHAMSAALSDAYACRPPTVLYNAFAWSDRKNLDGLAKDRNNMTALSIHWFSQTIGPSRGLEDLFAALPYLKSEVVVEVHLRGNPVADFDEWIAAHVPESWRSRVFVHDLVSNEELLSRIAEHDIGFAGEMKYSQNKDLTVSNKILQYLLAGLAVVASDTSGQKEVAGMAAGAVFLYPSGESLALAEKLSTLCASPDTLRHAKVAALKAAEQSFCWERQEGALLQSVSRALGTAA